MSGRRLRIAVVPGDGIGPEVVRQAVRVLEVLSASGAVAIETETFPWSAAHTLETGETLPDGALGRLATGFDAVFAGAFGDARVPDGRHARDILLGLRFGLDLYATVRPVRCLDERLSPLRDGRGAEVDFTVVRESTEGAYAGLGGASRKGTPFEVAIEEDLSTRRGTERVIRYAFDLARSLGRPRREGRRPRLVMADKHNAQPFGGGLWHRVFLEQAAASPDVEATHQFADALACRMVMDPLSLDVVVTGNLLGDVLSDLGAALQGGMGMAPSASLHPGRTSLFEPIHGSAPDLAGRDLANPFGAILTAALLLRERGAAGAAEVVEAAVTACVRSGEVTRDLGGGLGTRDAGEAVAWRVAAACAGRRG